MRTLEALAKSCHESLAADPCPSGREQVRQALITALADPTFVDAQFDETAADGPPKRRIFYQDEELGFRILAHADEGANEGKPHDHGPAWAIYGQAKGQTRMTEWRIIKAANGDAPAIVEQEKSYLMKPGDAVIYAEGAVHSPIRKNGTRLIRIESCSLEGVSRPKYQVTH